MEHWYVSDHHLSHWNIIQYAKRPFGSIAEMNDYLVEQHNAVVKPQDHVNFLGDVTMKRGGRLDREWLVAEMKRYNGHKRLFLGNHDHFPIKVYLEAGFEKIYATWRTKQGLLCSHIPVHPRSLGTAKANIHGHIHNNPDYEPVVINGKVVPYINVSVEAIAYQPINKDDLLRRIDVMQTRLQELSNVEVDEGKTT